MTRAKAAALETDVASQPVKQAFQSKKAPVTTATGRRAALGDVSNVGKTTVVEGKKPIKSTGLISKAGNPNGVQKATHARTTSTRTALGSKEIKKTEIKKTGSGAVSIGAATQKRKVTSTTSSVKQEEEVVIEEGEPPCKKIIVSENEKAAKLEHIDEKDALTDEAKPIYPPGVTNLDEEDIDDPLMAAEYATEIFEYLRDLECNSIPNPNYMEHQDDLEWKTRGILVDWLIEVHTRFHLLPETLFLAVNIIDRFLSEKVVQLERLQLVGITAMFIASKYEEVLSPHVANFSHVADDGFSVPEILSAERFILSTLNYDLSYPNPMNFLRRISKADNYDIQSRTIGKYLMEISLLDHRFMAYRPSHVAAASMYLSRMILDRGEWVSCASRPPPSHMHQANHCRMTLLPSMLATLRRRSSPSSSSWLTTSPGPSSTRHSTRSMRARSS